MINSLSISVFLFFFFLSHVVGVATWEDSLNLRKDWGINVRGVFDVRNLISKHPNYQLLMAKSGLSGTFEIYYFKYTISLLFIH